MGPAPTQRLLGQGRTGDPSRGAVPALVTSQCHMQIERRHGVPACGSQSGDGSAARRPPAETKTRETAGRVSGRGTPWAEAGRDSPGGGGRRGGRRGSEVVVRRGVLASALITGRAASRGLDGETGRRRGSGSEARVCCARPRGFEAVRPLQSSPHKLERSNS